MRILGGIESAGLGESLPGYSAAPGPECVDVASGVREWENPDFCKDATLNKYAKQGLRLFYFERAGDPQSGWKKAEGKQWNRRDLEDDWTKDRKENFLECDSFCIGPVSAFSGVSPKPITYRSTSGAS